MDEGFALLSEELAFARRMLFQESLLIGKMIAIAQLYTAYHTVSALLDMPAMQLYLDDPRMRALVVPLSEPEQRSMAAAMIGERNWLLRNLAIDSKEELAAARVKGVWTDFLVNIAYDPNASLNLVYLTMEPAAERASMGMDEVLALHMQGKLEPLGELCTKVLDAQLALIEERRRNGEFICPNPAMEFVLSNFDFLASYIERFYDLQNYMVLVNTKYALVRANIQKDEIQAFLTEKANFAHNQVTGETFTWEPYENTLSTPWVSTEKPSGGRGDDNTPPMKSNAVYIRLND